MFFYSNFKRRALATFIGVSKPNLEDYTIFNQICVFSSKSLTTSSSFMASTYIYVDPSMAIHEKIM